MNEKAKNDHLPPRRWYTIAAWGCFIVLLFSTVVILGFIAYTDEQEAKFGSAVDACTGMIQNVRADFQVAGRVIDKQGQPVVGADVTLDGLGIRECDETIRIHRTKTNETGAFSVGPVLFEYIETFFVKASIEGCQSEPAYMTQPAPDEINMVLRCITP